MTGQLEYSENPQNTKYLSSFCDILQRIAVGDVVEYERDVEGKNTEQVDDVEKGNKELDLKEDQNSLEFKKLNKFKNF